MRIALARILTQCPDVLLLDEPTNHLDIESIIWLENWIATEFKGALLMTSHDREFMNRVVSRVIEVSNKTFTTYHGNYDDYLREREVRLAQLLASHRRQQEMLAKEQDFIARFAARASHASQVQSRIKKIEKIERIEIPPSEKIVRFEFAATPRSGDDVLTLDGLGKTWSLPDGGALPVFGGASGLIRRGEKIALVGVNGAGKSTFLKVLAGKDRRQRGQCGLRRERPDGLLQPERDGSSRPGPNRVRDRAKQMTPLDTVGAIRNLCAAFLFQGDAVDKRVSYLSGGEKSRLLLATLLARPLNLLLLDEPTNHLDIQSRGILLGRADELPGHVSARQPRPSLPARPHRAGVRNRPRRDAHVRRGLRPLLAAPDARPLRNAARSCASQAPACL
jgi:ATP-binding cassette, subfamily F, member 3